MMFKFCLIVLLLEFQFKGIHSVPVICDIVDECVLEKTFEEICDFARSLYDDEIRNKVLEFLTLLKALPREKITKQRFNKGMPLVRAAFKGLKNDGICVRKKLDAMDALIGIMGLSPCSCYERSRSDPKLLEYWLETIAAFLCDNPLGSIESAPTQCECELMPLCELQKAYEELRCFAESFLNADIKNKVLEFLQRFQAVPQGKITKARFCAAAPLVRTALAALKDDCLCLKEKLEGIDALMALIGLVPTPCMNTEIQTRLWDEWISGISRFLKENNPIPSLIPVK